MQTRIVFVELTNGETPFPPMKAIAEPDGSFTLPPEAPAGERWRPAAGERVICEWLDLGDGKPSRVAVRVA